jgi:GDP-L-fucose synthase
MVGTHFRHAAIQAGLDVLAPARKELDLRDKAATHAFVTRTAPDLIVHCAGRVGGIAANMAAPYEFLVENLEIGANLANAAVAARVPKLLNLASSCVYPRDVEGQLSEDLILTGQMEPTNEGYALAKIAMLRLCEFATRKDPGLNYKSLIPCNLYGPHDNFDAVSAHLIPAIIRKIHDAKTKNSDQVEIWGDGSARREFMYAGDLAQCMLRACQYFEAVPEVMNVGLGFDHSVLEYYQAVASVVGWNGRFTFDLNRPVGMRRKLVSISRQERWGWKPPSSLEEGIRRTYEHFLQEHRK